MDVEYWIDIGAQTLVVLGVLASVIGQVVKHDPAWEQKLRDHKKLYHLIFVVGLLSIAYTGWKSLGSSQTAGVTVLSGLRSTYASASDATGRIQGHIQRANRSVKILDTYLGNFDSLQASISRALKRCADCEVRILVAKPKGRLADARGALYPPSQIADNVTSLLSRILVFQKQIPTLAARISVRHFDVLVPGPFFVVDDQHIFIGTFLQTDGSQNTPMLEFDLNWWTINKDVGRLYVATFDKLWSEGEQASFGQQ